MQPKFGRVIFIDRSLASKRLPEMLERMGFEVERHKDHFVHDEDDDKWIPPVSARQWLILTGDKRLSKEPANIEAVLTSRAQVLVVTDSNSLPEQWASAVIVGRQRIQELLDKNPGPTFINIGRYAKDHVNLNKPNLPRQPNSEGIAGQSANGSRATATPEVALAPPTVQHQAVAPLVDSPTAPAS
jgi:hypothetical protein